MADDADLTHFLAGILEHLNINDGASKSKIKKLVRTTETFKCVTCWHEFDRMGDLMRHLRKRSHVKPMAELMEEWEEFHERVNHKTRIEYSKAEEHTYQIICVKYAHLIKMHCKTL